MASMLLDVSFFDLFLQGTFPSGSIPEMSRINFHAFWTPHSLTVACKAKKRYLVIEVNRNKLGILVTCDERLVKIK